MVKDSDFNSCHPCLPNNVHNTYKAIFHTDILQKKWKRQLGDDKNPLSIYFIRVRPNDFRLLLRKIKSKKGVGEWKENKNYHSYWTKLLWAIFDCIFENVKLQSSNRLSNSSTKTLTHVYRKVLFYFIFLKVMFFKLLYVFSVFGAMCAHALSSLHLNFYHFQLSSTREKHCQRSEREKFMEKLHTKHSTNCQISNAKDECPVRSKQHSLWIAKPKTTTIWIKIHFENIKNNSHTTIIDHFHPTAFDICSEIFLIFFSLLLHACHVFTFSE